MSQILYGVNFCAPNLDDQDFFMNKFRLTEQMGNDLKFIGGDFNLTMDDVLDRKSNKKTLTAEAVKNGLPIPQITFFWM